VDNFSAGTRGSASAEYFLEKSYAVIFIHRLVIERCKETDVSHWNRQCIIWIPYLLAKELGQLVSDYRLDDGGSISGRGKAFSL
jgi:hypothetical protein